MGIKHFVDVCKGRFEIPGLNALWLVSRLAGLLPNNLLHSSFLRLIFDTQNGGDTFLQYDGSDRTTLGYIAQDGNIHIHRCEILKFY
jgi:hypothetical protein